MGGESISRVDRRRIAAYGSFNNWNCGVIYIDVEKGEEIAGGSGQCGSFSNSPDAKHVASLETTSGGPDEERIDNVVIGKSSYPGGNPGNLVVTSLNWSPDSNRVASIQHNVNTGESALCVLSIQGRRTRVPSPSHI